MKNKYSKKQILESIRYWQNKLNESNEKHTLADVIKDIQTHTEVLDKGLDLLKANKIDIKQFIRRAKDICVAFDIIANDVEHIASDANM